MIKLCFDFNFSFLIPIVNKYYLISNSVILNILTENNANYNNVYYYQDVSESTFSIIFYNQLYILINITNY